MGGISEEGYDLNIYDLASSGDTKDFILEKMRKYAEWYAKQTLKKAFDTNTSAHPLGSSIFKGSIMDIKLPPHE